MYKVYKDRSGSQDIDGKNDDRSPARRGRTNAAKDEVSVITANATYSFLHKAPRGKQQRGINKHGTESQSNTTEDKLDMILNILGRHEEMLTTIMAALDKRGRVEKGEKASVEINIARESKFGTAQVFPEQNQPGNETVQGTGASGQEHDQSAPLPADDAGTEEVVDSKERYRQTVDQVAAFTEESYRLVTEQVRAVREEIEKLEPAQNQNAVLVYGVLQQRNEHLRHIIDDIAFNIGGIRNVNKAIKEIYRDGKPTPNYTRPIKVVFNSQYERDRFFNKRKYFSDAQIFVNPDRSEEERKKISLLRKVQKEAVKKDPKAKVVDDKLRYKGKLLTVEEVKASDIPTESTCQITTNSQVRFYGCLSPFSNFYTCNFKVKGKTYKSVEHFYQFTKAVMHGDLDTAARIDIQADNPSKIKALSHPLKQASVGKWNAEVMLAVMTEGLEAKFSDPLLMSKLLATGKREFVECNPHCTVWSCGLGLRDERVATPSKWLGVNQLGKALTVLRDKCKKQQHSPIQ